MILKEDDHQLSKLMDLIRLVIREDKYSIYFDCIEKHPELITTVDYGRAEWLTTGQTAILLQICPTSLEKARSLGRGPLASIPYHKIGRSVRYARTDVVTALERLRVPGRMLKS